MIRAVDEMTPTIADSAYVDEAAVVIEAGASVWPNTTLRGDHCQTVVGERVNVHETAVLHEDAVLGPETTVGHSAIVHAATVGEGALVGMNAVVLDDGPGADDGLLAGVSVVTEGTEVPPATLAVGTPADPKAELDDPDTRVSAEHYAELATRYAKMSERLD